MTLISTHNSESCTGRCDSRCYLAEGPVCTCCGGGRNHGVGLQQAMDNTHEYAQEIVDRWNSEHPGERLAIAPVQGLLFGDEVAEAAG